MRSIQEHWGEIKGLADSGLADWGVFAVVILACLASFGLGRLSVLEQGRPPVVVSHIDSKMASEPLVLGGMLVGSVNGDAYHYPWCAGAAKITAQNQRLFASAAAARAEGYKPAKNCVGLE